ncbi:MAG: antibiotic biosynthesis monooxygenase [Acidimicrobiales bacterium]
MTLSLPWVEHQAFETNRTYVSMASRLPLRSHRFIPGFLSDTLRIRRQLAATPGLVAYGLQAQLAAKTFWTFSVWEDQASLDAFARSDPHRRITARLKAHMGNSRFRFVEVDGSDLPWSWAQVVASLHDD